MGSTPPNLQASLDRDGFVVIPSLVSGASLETLRKASAHVTQQARAGKWPYIRTLPKQFPPWPSKPGPEGIWGVQHLLHPDLPLPTDVDQNAFQASYFADSIARAVGEIVGITSAGDNDKPGNEHNDLSSINDELVMELYNLLVRPDSDFALRWHRDDIPADASPETERARLCPPDEKVREYAHAQWNLALYEDESLIVVPGSHKRARTAEEYQLLSQNPWAEKLPEQLIVRLEPGDVVFYDNNILHRGVYTSQKDRMTLHGSMSRKGKAEERARNVLQHGVGEWVGRCDFGGLPAGLKLRAEGMRERLVEMGSERSGKAVEYSQVD